MNLILPGGGATNLKGFIAEFRPNRPGLGKVLGKLEAAVMEVAWRRGEATVRDVYDTLRCQREIAYTTVMTIMTRLAEKGLLEKRKEGNAYVYLPALSRQEFNASVAGQVLDGLLDEYAEAAFAHFVDRLSKEDAGRLAELERLIKERQRKEE